MRFTDLGVIDPVSSVSYDQAVFEARDAGSVPDTLFIYTRDRRTVSLGKSRHTEDDVFPDIPDDVAVVRRMSGGSSVLTGPDQIVYSLILGGRIPARSESFKMICGGLIGALSELGIDSEYKPPNDVLVAGKKISGSAQYRNSRCMIQHGTLILKPDPLMFRIIKPADQSYNGLTSVYEILGRVPDRSEISDALMKGFSEQLGMPIHRGELTDLEKHRARELCTGP